MTGGRRGRPTVALLTDPAHPALGPDDAPLIEAFRDAGWDPVPRHWRTPVQGDDLIVVRSCWDYAACRDEFLAQMVAWTACAPLLNPIETLRWNSSKRYLFEMSAAGLPVPETTIVEAGESTSLHEAMSRVESSEVVVKPVVGASGIDTWVARDAADPRWHSPRGAVLVQRFMPEIQSEGEISLIWFRDGFSHAVVKRPREGEFRVQSDHGGHTEAFSPGPDLLAQAERALATVTRPWWYARVDGIWSEGRFVLMELELVEPEFFFLYEATAAKRFVATLPMP